MAFEYLPQQSDGDIIGAPLWNKIVGNVNFRGNGSPKAKATVPYPPGVSPFGGTGGWTNIEWLGEEYSFGGLHSRLVQSDKFTAVRTGYYYFCANLRVAADASPSTMFMSIWANDTIELARSQVTQHTSLVYGVFLESTYRLVANDFLSLRCFPLDDVLLDTGIQRAMMHWISD